MRSFTEWEHINNDELFIVIDPINRRSLCNSMVLLRNYCIHDLNLIGLHPVSTNQLFDAGTMDYVLPPRDRVAEELSALAIALQAAIEELRYDEVSNGGHRPVLETKHSELEVSVDLVNGRELRAFTIFLASCKSRYFTTSRWLL